MTEALLSLTGVTKHYPGTAAAKRDTGGKGDGARPALDRVSLTVAPGETVGLVGESGSGKSTLARLSLGLLAPTSGTVRFAGHDPYRLRGRSARPVRARLQFVPQHPRGSLNPALRAGEAVAFALRTQGTPRRERPDRTAELFRQVGLDPALASRYPRELSGGSSSGWPWPARWRPAPSWWSATNRPRRSISGSRPRYWICSSSSRRAGGSRISSSPTIWPWSAWLRPTGWWC